MSWRDGLTAAEQRRTIALANAIRKVEHDASDPAPLTTRERALIEAQTTRWASAIMDIIDDGGQVPPEIEDAANAAFRGGIKQKALDALEAWINGNLRGDVRRNPRAAEHPTNQIERLFRELHHEAQRIAAAMGEHNWNNLMSMDFVDGDGTSDEEMNDMAQRYKAAVYFHDPEMHKQTRRGKELRTNLQRAVAYLHTIADKYEDWVAQGWEVDDMEWTEPHTMERRRAARWNPKGNARGVLRKWAQDPRVEEVYVEQGDRKGEERYWLHLHEGYQTDGGGQSISTDDRELAEEGLTLDGFISSEMANVREARQNPTPMSVQSLLFSREHGWTKTSAQEWAGRHGYHSQNSRMDITPRYVRIRQADPKSERPGSFRTITFSEEQGIKAVVAKRK